MLIVYLLLDIFRFLPSSFAQQKRRIYTPLVSNRIRSAFSGFRAYGDLTKSSHTAT